ncbi:jg856, partial [Pararge aegeria aegeria]
SPGGWATVTLSHTSANQLAAPASLWDILKRPYNRQSRTGNTRRAFQPEDLSPTGDGFPASIAQGSTSRGAGGDYEHDACARSSFDVSVEIRRLPLSTAPPLTASFCDITCSQKETIASQDLTACHT